ncbi:hypothetical protein WJX73_003301 [Symbiochloris irregularis]|uniref:Mercuric reductase n=1 Tax=Symbiochloris irregularis TaxID=706552 RepID=A0AAW1P7I7_9CHLO
MQLTSWKDSQPPAGYDPETSPLDEHNIKLLDNVHPLGWQQPAERMKKYNLVIIGGGAGGLVSAAGSAGVGGKVALIEKHLMGGDCLNVGCVPSKALIRCANAARAARSGQEFGITVGKVEVDFPGIMRRMRRLRADISPTDSCARFQTELGIDIFQGTGKFIGPRLIEVNGQKIQFASAVIATGALARVPDIPGIHDVPYLTNATFFNLTELPERMVVMGSGPIGLELAQAMAVLGSKVTVIEKSARVMGREDPEAAKIVLAQMEKDGVEFITNAKIERFEKDSASSATLVHVDAKSGKQTLHADAFLLAIGRVPTVKNLGLEEVGVEYTPERGIKIDDTLHTTASHVFAVGDCCDAGNKFTHASDFMARAVIRNALFFGSAKLSKLVIPRATYTEPEVAAVGATEDQLKKDGTEFLTIVREMADVDRARLDEQTEGFVKVLAKPGSGEIFGATIVAPDAGNMISEISVAMAAGMGLGTLASVIHPYPTQAEAIRQCGDLFNKTKLTPFVKGTFDKLLAFRRR